MEKNIKNLEFFASIIDPKIKVYESNFMNLFAVNLIKEIEKIETKTMPKI